MADVFPDTKKCHMEHVEPVPSGHMLLNPTVPAAPPPIHDCPSGVPAPLPGSTPCPVLHPPIATIEQNDSIIVPSVSYTISPATDCCGFNFNLDIKIPPGGPPGPPGGSYQTIQVNGVPQPQEPKLNLLPGPGSTITTVDDPLNNRTNITITVPGNLTTLTLAPQTPVTITTNQNDYNPGSPGTVFELTSTGPVSITGWIASPDDGALLIIKNVSDFPIELFHLDVLSAADNQFWLPYGQTLTLDSAPDVGQGPPYPGSAMFIYQAALPGWLCIGYIPAYAYWPTQNTDVSANLNDYDADYGNIIAIDGGAADRTFTGLIARVDGTPFILVNRGPSHSLIFTNEDASSAASNRIHTDTGASITLDPSAMALGWYDLTLARHRLALLGGGGATISFSGARIMLSNPQGLTDSMVAVLTGYSASFDTDSYYNGGTHPTRLTIPATGYYEVSCRLLLTWVTTAPITIQFGALYNGSGAPVCDAFFHSAFNGATAQCFIGECSRKLFLSAGNYLEFGVYITGSSDCSADRGAIGTGIGLSSGFEFIGTELAVTRLD